MINVNGRSDRPGDPGRCVAGCVGYFERNAERLEGPQDKPNFRTRLSVFDFDQPFAASTSFAGKRSLVEAKLQSPIAN